MKTLIRIEHPIDNKGLWHSVDTEKGYTRIYSHSKSDDICDRHEGGNYPTFQEDYALISQLSKDESASDYKFAFLSLDQLKEALTSEELKECINELGFKVLMIDVTSHIESKFQAIFKPKHVSQTKDISFMFL